MVVAHTHHALFRQAQRNLSADDIEFVLDYGRWMRIAGAWHVFLGRRDIPRDAATARRYSRLEGTTLVIAQQAEERVLLTAYRNRRALKNLRSRAGSRTVG
jgi:hypothetical protein